MLACEWQTSIQILNLRVSEYKKRNETNVRPLTCARLDGIGINLQLRAVFQAQLARLLQLQHPSVSSKVKRK